MKIDTIAIKQGTDLLAIISRDTELKKVTSTNGGEWSGPCPFCGGVDRFSVWPNREEPGWWCRQCGSKGDVITYLMQRDNLDFKTVYEQLSGGKMPTTTTPGIKSKITRPKAYRLEAPSKQWQHRGNEFVNYARQMLWDNAQALDYLHGRGLTDDTIKSARFGWNPKAIKDRPDHWGLVETDRVWLPAGLVMPWYVGDELWRIEIRTPEGEKIGPTGFKQGLYNVDALASDKPAVIVEGVIDCLTISQFAADLIVPVATGSTSHARQSRWIARLAQCPVVLVAFDNEPDKGEKAAQYWLKVLPNAKRWRPFWEDVNQMAQDGTDIRQWIEAGLPSPDPEFVKIIWPAGLPRAVVVGQTRKLSNGDVEAWYSDKAELADHLELTKYTRELASANVTNVITSQAPPEEQLAIEAESPPVPNHYSAD